MAITNHLGKWISTIRKPSNQCFNCNGQMASTHTSVIWEATSLSYSCVGTFTAKFDEHSFWEGVRLPNSFPMGNLWISFRPVHVDEVGEFVIVPFSEAHRKSFEVNLSVRSLLRIHVHDGVHQSGDVYARIRLTTKISTREENESNNKNNNNKSTNSPSKFFKKINTWSLFTRHQQYTLTLQDHASSHQDQRERYRTFYC